MKTIYVLTVVLALVGTQVTVAEARMSEAELFKHKQVCADLMPTIEKKISQGNGVVPETGARFISSLEKIFYSPKKNSCLYYWSTSSVIGRKRISKDLYLQDALTGELLLTDQLYYEEKELDWRKQTAGFEELVASYEANL